MKQLKLGDWSIPEYTAPVGTVDIVSILGRSYPTIVAPGGLEWMAVNLGAYGTGPRYPADHVTNPTLRATLDKYGALYLYKEALTLPLLGGWRLPTVEEFSALVALCASPRELKSSTTGDLSDGRIVWQAPNTGAAGAFGVNLHAAGYYISEYWQSNVSQEGTLLLSDGSAYYLGYTGGYGPVPYDATKRRSIRLVRPSLYVPAQSGTHDILLDGDTSGSAILVEDLAQRVDCRLRTFQGEHWLNPEIGVPWFEEFLGQKNPNLSVCRSLLLTVIQGVPGVTAVTSLDLGFAKNSNSRVLEVRFTVTGTDSLPVSGTTAVTA